MSAAGESKANGDRRSIVKRPIAVFIPSLHDRGGTERATLRCIRAWATEREVWVFARDAEIELSNNVRLTSVKLPSRPALLAWLCFVAWSSLHARRVRRDARRPIVFTPGANLFGADLTVVHMYYRQYRDVLVEDEMAGNAPRIPRLKRPMFVPDWSVIHSDVYAFVVRRVERIHYRRSRFVFAVSEWEAAALRNAGIRVEGIAPNGVDAGAFAPARFAPLTKTTRLLCVGSEIVKKGLDLLLDALSHNDLRSRTSLTLVTRAKNEPALRRFAASANYDALTVVSDSRPAERLFSDCDIYVAPSREDSFNMPALEAMAAGIPVVLSNRCGLSAAAAANRAALIVDPNPEQIAEAISRIIEDPGLRHDLVQRGREFARANPWDKTVAALQPCLDTMDSEVFAFKLGSR